MPEKWEHFTGDGPPEEEDGDTKPKTTPFNLPTELIAAIALLVGVVVTFLLMSGPRQTSTQAPPVEQPTYRTVPSASTISAPTVDPAEEGQRLARECRAKLGYWTFDANAGRLVCLLPESVGRGDKGTMPNTPDCIAKGGYRTINPTTGNPSCFVPDRSSRGETAKMPNTPDCAAKGGYRTINPSTGRPSCYVP